MRAFAVGFASSLLTFLVLYFLRIVLFGVSGEGDGTPDPLYLIPLVICLGVIAGFARSLTMGLDADRNGVALKNNVSRRNVPWDELADVSYHQGHNIVYLKLVALQGNNGRVAGPRSRSTSPPTAPAG